MHTGDPVARQIHDVAASLQKLIEVGGDIEVVLDDQDAHGFLSPPRGRPNED